MLARRAVSFLLGRTKAQRSGQGKLKLGVKTCQRTNLKLPTKRRTGNVQNTEKTFREHGGFPESFSTSTVASGADPGTSECRMPVVQLLTLLLMAILTKALLTLVRSNFVTFTFFSARHTAAKLSCEL
jgi:hypothetical protein